MADDKTLEQQNNAPEVTQTQASEGFEEKLLQAVVERVDQRMESFEQQLKEEVMEKVDQKVEQLRTTPSEDAETFIGGTPKAPMKASGVRIGEDPLSSRKYSYFRLLSVLWGVDGAEEQAKLELALSRQLKDYYVTRQFSLTGQRRTFLAPFGSEMLPQDIDNVPQKGHDAIPAEQIAEMLQDPISVRRLQSLQNRAMSGAMQARVRQALSMFDDTKLGVFTDAQISGELIELVRAVEVFPRAGVREVTLPPNGYLPLASQTGAATGAWVGEAATISSSEPSTGKIELRAKKAAALVVVPNELFRFSTRDTEAFLRADLTRVLALLVDKAGLEGTGGTTQPLGILNRSGKITKTASTVGANGDTLEPNDLSGMIAEVEERNHDVDARGWVWIMRGKMWRNILNRRAAAVASGDQEGPYLFAVNREAIQNGLPGQLLGWPVIKSGQVSNTRSKGTASDLTYILGGIPDDVIIGRVGVLEFALGTEGTVGSTNLFESDQAAIRAIEHVDFAWRHEDSWAVIDTIDPDLPSGVI